MPLRTAIAAAGILEPDDMAILTQVFETLALDTDTDIDREARAAALVRLYQSGVTTEEQLLEAAGHSPSDT